MKCGECPNQAFIPVTEQTIHDHLQGRHVIGVYPMVPDETCWFLAVDFDKGQWQDDVSAFINTCKAKGVPHAVERSRSGNGAHVWFFFDTPVSASTARKMGCFLITETMAGRHELPMTSYDRFFPTRTSCLVAASATSSLCRFRTARASRGTRYSSTRHGRLSLTSGLFWPRYAG